jgi:hypothetical protein
MDGRRVIEELVPQANRNASVVSVEEREREYAVTLAGTTGVTAHCELSREAVEGAGRPGGARQRVLSELKRCADQVVVEIPDGRG